MTTVTTLAPAQGDYVDDRPAEKQPGTKAHLGENPYQGAVEETAPPKPAAKKASSGSSS